MVPISTPLGRQRRPESAHNPPDPQCAMLERPKFGQSVASSRDLWRRKHQCLDRRKHQCNHTQALMWEARCAACEQAISEKTTLWPRHTCTSFVALPVTFGGHCESLSRFACRRAAGLRTQKPAQAGGSANGGLGAFCENQTRLALKVSRGCVFSRVRARPTLGSIHTVNFHSVQTSLGLDAPTSGSCSTVLWWRATDAATKSSKFAHSEVPP